jgi:hypothetical protein
MPNHVHLILTPQDGEGLAGAPALRPRRRAGQRPAADRPRAAFRRPHRGRSGRCRLRPLETERADRPAARFRELCGGDRETSRADARAGQARPQAAKPGHYRGSIRVKTGVSPLFRGTRARPVIASAAKQSSRRAGRGPRRSSSLPSAQRRKDDSDRPASPPPLQIARGRANLNPPAIPRLLESWRGKRRASISWPISGTELR